MYSSNRFKAGLKSRDSARWVATNAAKLDREKRTNMLKEHRQNTRTNMFMKNRPITNQADSPVGRKSPAGVKVKNTMAKHSELYKTKGRKFESENLNRCVQSKNLQDERKDKRAQLFSRNRNVPVETKKVGFKPATPKAATMAPKVQSTKKPKSSLENRPPFVVGIVHYPLCPIPPLNVNLPPRACRQMAAKSEEKIKKISKATEKRLAAKGIKPADIENVTVASGKTPRLKQACKSVIKSSKVERTKKDKENQKTTNIKVKLNASHQVEQEKLTVEDNKEMKEEDVGLNATFEMDSEKSFIKKNEDMSIKAEPVSIKINNSSVESVHLEMSAESGENSVSKNDKPNFISPYVVCSRGRKNARDEQKARLSMSTSSPNDDVPTKETVMEKLNVSLEEEEKTAEYLMHSAKKEEERLKELCVLWESEMKGVSKRIKLKIEAVVEDARVLINKKFDWFLSLANNCQHGDGDQLVSSKDLLYFWEMVRGEIQEIDKGFDCLTELKSRNWQTTPELKESLSSTVDKYLLAANKCPPKFTSTPKAQLNKSLSDELRFLTIETPEIVLNSSISYINSEQTPARGILKKSDDRSSSGEKGNKSMQKVNFNDTVVTAGMSDQTPLQQQTPSRTEDHPTDDEDFATVRVDRKLIFDESDHSRKTKSIFAEMMEVQNLNSEVNKNQEEEVMEEQKTHDNGDNNDDTEIFVRSLRSRTIWSSSKGRSKSENFANGEKSASTRRRKHHHAEDTESLNTPAKRQNNRKTISFATPYHLGEDLVLTEKRSIRKSVKFDEDACTACTPQKRQQKSATSRKSGSAKKIRF